jgi:hypothetical protein
VTVYSGIAAELPFLRAEAEAAMTLTFTVHSPNGYTTVSGLKVPAYADQGSTPGKVQGGAVSTRDPVSRMVVIGGVERPLLEGGLQIPISATVPKGGDRGVGWEYLCAAVGPLDDPALLNRRYLVVSVPAKSFATARRLDVVEV